MNNLKITKLTKKLINIASVSGEFKHCNEALGVALRQLGGFKHKTYEKERVKSLLFYNTKTFPKKFKIILNAHLDVVPGKDYQFRPKVKKGKLCGRGAYDMKTACAVFILIFKELADKVDYPLGLQLVTDEETGGFNGTKHQIDQGVRAKFVIGGEATNLAINTQAKGILRLKLTTKGKTAHGAYPWQGENALQKLNNVIHDLFQSYPVPKKEEWKTTFNLAWVKTDNETINKVPDKGEAIFDIRFIPQDADNIKNKITEIVNKRAEIEFPFDEPAQFTKRENKYVQGMVKMIEKNTGEKCNFIKKHGGSDLRHYERVGVEGMLFGLKGSGLHSDDEWVDINSLDTYYDILKNFLLSIN